MIEKRFFLCPLLLLLLLSFSATEKVPDNIDFESIIHVDNETDTPVASEVANSDPVIEKQNPAPSPGPNPPAEIRTLAKVPRGTIDIQRLIDASLDGSSIEIPFGEYIIDKSLNVLGRIDLCITSQPGTRILLRNNNADVLAISGSSEIVIENILLRHELPLKQYACHGSVLSITDSHTITIKNCDLNGCGAVGVFAENCGNLTISGCWIHDNTFNGIYLSNTEEVSIRNCIIENNKNMIQTSNVNGLKMSDNLIRNNGVSRQTSNELPGLSGFPE